MLAKLSHIASEIRSQTLANVSAIHCKKPVSELSEDWALEKPPINNKGTINKDKINFFIINDALYEIKSKTT